ncbi:MAG: tetratricopeptide repeat protein [Phycisphaerae bacterium]|nr:tetratricopeptide repeat protein [Phycisphaerae bacterium]
MVQPTTKSGLFRRPWRIVVFIIAAGLLGTAGWYYLHPFAGNASSDLPRQTKSTRPESPVAVAETPWLPANWEQLGDQQKIEFLKKDELSQAEALVAEFSGSDDALVTLGNVYRKQGKSVEALTCWEKALAINPYRIDAFDGMAMVAMEKGDHTRAAELWGKALTLRPEVQEYRSYQAQALSRAGRHQHAIEVLEEELRRFPQSAMAHYLLGQEYMLIKDFSKAKSCYERAIEYAPNHTGAYYGLMTVCLRLKMNDEAKRAKVRFDECKVRDTLDTRNLLRSRNDLGGSWKAAIETYLAAESLYRRTGDFDRAGISLRRAEAIDPDHPRVLTRKAEGYRSRGQLVEALTIHEKIARSNPEDILNQFNMAGICLELKRYDKAQTALESVLSQAPGFDGGYRELARLFLIQGRDIERARELAARSVELSATAANYFVYSWASDRTGDHTGAVAALKQAVTLEPDNPLYQEKFRLATMNE